MQVRDNSTKRNMINYNLTQNLPDSFLTFAKQYRANVTKKQLGATFPCNVSAKITQSNKNA